MSDGYREGAVIVCPCGKSLGQFTGAVEKDVPTKDIEKIFESMGWRFINKTWVCPVCTGIKTDPLVIKKE